MSTLFAVESCAICGPLEPPAVHVICHPEKGLSGCGHALVDHSNGLKCRVCGRECGVSPQRWEA